MALQNPSQFSIRTELSAGMVEVGLENMRLKMLEYGVNHHYTYLL